MTTIAYRDGILAADTSIWDRGTYAGCVEKICRAPNGFMGGMAGCLGDTATFLAWLKAGAEGDPPASKDEDSEGLLISPDGTLEWIGCKDRRVVVDNPYFATGSGFRVAMGALHAGATAEKAIEVACDLDCTTQRPITVLKLVQTKGT